DFFNRRWLDYVGLPFEEVKGWGWSKVVHPEDMPSLTAAWQTALSTGVGGATEARMRQANGEYRWFLFRANALLDETGNVVRWFGVNTDIEDSKRAEDALRGNELNL